ncbi:MAG: hypothetical protein M3426_00880 [Actinomycetota bacterium]|nr:hypothetical protein [Actinomycetota bacterium]
MLEGNTTLFVRGDEAEEAWQVVEPILEAWEQELVPLLEYPAGSDGPTPEALEEPVVRSSAPEQGIG